MLDSVLIIDKPAGITSARVVGRVKRLFPRGTKVGHAGTLDQFATGVLLVLVGKATKRCEELMNGAKQYEATIKLGATTETDDPESPERPFEPSRPENAEAEASESTGTERPSREAVLHHLTRFLGAIDQVPPAYSALKIAGKRASDRFRAGEAIELKPRRVHIYDIGLLEYVWPLVRIKVDCGRGTYIRAIARDLGVALQTGGYLTQLRRTRVGEFDIARAKTFEELGVITESRPG